ncbi:uncharacterized protein LOC129946899 [Eupeodes corollae]|uniref:uncharacterized protein LOC129946899 n=1 Tax=Eupeodes corollae TaxID=290404 RepID=UPI00249121B6|nr:uncharacterized protein LOC129946899 [Eupeodes corollae]
MKLLFVFCCLSAGCILWTEASPFLFNLQKNVQIQRQPVVRQQGFNFGFGGIISKWFPSIVVNKQFGTRRPKASQRPVIEVTTVFEPSGDLDKEDVTTSTTTKLPAEVIDIFGEKPSSSSSESPVDEVEKDSSTTTTTTTTEEPSEEVNNYTEEETTSTSTTTALPFEEIEPFTESKTSTTTTELPFEETEPETNPSSNESEGSELSTDIKTSTTTTTTTTESTYEEIENNNENASSLTEGSQYVTDSKTSTTEIPSEGNSDASTTSNAESLINSIGFTTEGYTTSSSSSSTEDSKPDVEYLPSGSDKEEVADIKPTTYRPLYVPTTFTTTTTTTTIAPWKETPANIVNTGGYVDVNKPIESYVYVRPQVSFEDIQLNEVSPKARPFESISLVGTTSNGKRVERTYKPQPEPIGVINERPRVTFYSNY